MVDVPLFLVLAESPNTDWIGIGAFMVFEQFFVPRAEMRVTSAQQMLEGLVLVVAKRSSSKGVMQSGTCVIESEQASSVRNPMPSDQVHLNGAEKVMFPRPAPNRASEGHRVNPHQAWVKPGPMNGPGPRLKKLRLIPARE